MFNDLKRFLCVQNDSLVCFTREENVGRALCLSGMTCPTKGLQEIIRRLVGAEISDCLVS